jgi:hypothetical protein
VAELVALRQLEARSSQRADDLRTVAQWLERDILSLAGPERAARQYLFDFIVDVLHQREPEDPSRIGAMRVALQNQRDDLLAFSVLDDKLAAIARAAAVPDYLRSTTPARVQAATYTGPRCPRASRRTWGHARP